MPLPKNDRNCISFTHQTYQQRVGFDNKRDEKTGKTSMEDTACNENIA
jgi:hypothetical protein